jgi:hypothetical protein
MAPAVSSDAVGMGFRAAGRWRGAWPGRVGSWLLPRESCLLARAAEMIDVG